MRLVQRHGRIDRIGSKHREVFIRCVFPDTRLDELLGLEERLNRKIAQAAASIGVGAAIPTSSADSTAASARPARRSSGCAPKMPRSSSAAAPRWVLSPGRSPC